MKNLKVFLFILFLSIVAVKCFGVQHEITSLPCVIGNVTADSTIDVESGDTVTLAGSGLVSQTNGIICQKDYIVFLLESDVLTYGAASDPDWTTAAVSGINLDNVVGCKIVGGHIQHADSLYTIDGSDFWDGPWYTTCIDFEASEACTTYGCTLKPVGNEAKAINGSGNSIVMLGGLLEMHRAHGQVSRDNFYAVGVNWVKTFPLPINDPDSFHIYIDSLHIKNSAFTCLNLRGKVKIVNCTLTIGRHNYLYDFVDQSDCVANIPDWGTRTGLDGCGWGQSSQYACGIRGNQLFAGSIISDNYIAAEENHYGSDCGILLEQSRGTIEYPVRIFNNVFRIHTGIDTASVGARVGVAKILKFRSLISRVNDTRYEFYDNLCSLVVGCPNDTGASPTPWLGHYVSPGDINFYSADYDFADSVVFRNNDIIISCVGGNDSIAEFSACRANISTYDTTTFAEHDNHWIGNNIKLNFESGVTYIGRKPHIYQFSGFDLAATSMVFEEDTIEITNKPSDLLAVLHIQDKVINDCILKNICWNDTTLDTSIGWYNYSQLDTSDISIQYTYTINARGSDDIPIEGAICTLWNNVPEIVWIDTSDEGGNASGIVTTYESKRWYKDGASDSLETDFNKFVAHAFYDSEGEELIDIQIEYLAANKVCSLAFSDNVGNGTSGWTETTDAPVLTSVTLNSGASTIYDKVASIEFTYTGKPDFMLLSESGIFTGAEWQSFYEPAWLELSDGIETKTVFAKLKNDSGSTTTQFDQIDVDTTSIANLAGTIGRDSTEDNTVYCLHEAIGITMNSDISYDPTYVVASAFDKIMYVGVQAYSDGGGNDTIEIAPYIHHVDTLTACDPTPPTTPTRSLDTRIATPVKIPIVSTELQWYFAKVEWDVGAYNGDTISIAMAEARGQVFVGAGYLHSSGHAFQFERYARSRLGATFLKDANECVYHSDDYMGWSLVGYVSGGPAVEASAIDTNINDITIRATYTDYTNLDTIWVFYDDDGTIADATEVSNVVDLSTPTDQSITSLLENHDYDFWVIACDDNGRDTSDMIEVTTLQTVSHDISEVDSTKTTFTISDNYTANDVDTVWLWYDTDIDLSDGDSTMETTGISDPSILVATGLTEGTLYYYAFGIHDQLGRDVSTTYSISTITTMPTDPTDTVAFVGDHSDYSTGPIGISYATSLIHADYVYTVANSTDYISVGCVQGKGNTSQDDTLSMGVYVYDDVTEEATDLIGTFKIGFPGNVKDVYCSGINIPLADYVGQKICVAIGDEINTVDVYVNSIGGTRSLKNNADNPVLTDPWGTGETPSGYSWAFWAIISASDEGSAIKKKKMLLLNIGE